MTGDKSDCGIGIPSLARFYLHTMKKIATRSVRPGWSFHVLHCVLVDDALALHPFIFGIPGSPDIGRH